MSIPVSLANPISIPGRPVPLSPGVDPCQIATCTRSLVAPWQHVVSHVSATHVLFGFTLSVVFSFSSFLGALGWAWSRVWSWSRVEPRRGDKPDVTEVLLSVTCRREIVVCMTGRRTARTVDDTKTCEWRHSVSDVVWNLAIYMNHDRLAAGLHGVIDRSYIQRTPCIDLNELDLTTEFLATRRT